jgi:hypothetical protein
MQTAISDAVVPKRMLCLSFATGRENGQELTVINPDAMYAARHRCPQARRANALPPVFPAILCGIASETTWAHLFLRFLIVISPVWGGQLAGGGRNGEADAKR